MAHLIVQLNDRWRVSDDPPQWTLEERDGKAREKATGWAARKFIRDRDHLLRRIGELCGRVDPTALAAIRCWSVGYVSWKATQPGYGMPGKPG